MTDPIDAAGLRDLLKFYNDYVKQDKKAPDFLKDQNIDKDKDEFIYSDDNIDPLRKMTQGTIPKKNPDTEKDFTQDEIKALQKAQKLLIDAATKLKKPPADLQIFLDKFKKDLANPYKPSNAALEKSWQKDRLSYKGITFNINPDSALGYVQESLKGKEDAPIKDRAKAVVAGLWENYDYSNKKTFRMEEILGVQLYIETLDGNEKEEFRTAFFEEMAKYIDEKFGKDAQFMFDSLISLIQSTDWSGEENDDLQDFTYQLAKGIAKNGSFAKKLPDDFGKDNAVIVGNYNGTNDGKPFGSLALIRYKEKNAAGDEVTKLEWLEYDTASQLNKTKYTFDKSKPTTTFKTETKPQRSGDLTKDLVQDMEDLKEYLKNILDPENAPEGVTVPIVDYTSLPNVRASLQQAQARLELAYSLIASGREVDQGIVQILQNLIEELENAAKDLNEKEYKEVIDFLKQKANNLKEIITQATKQNYEQEIGRQGPIDPRVYLALGDIEAIIRNIMGPLASKTKKELEEDKELKPLIPLKKAASEIEGAILQGIQDPRIIDRAYLASLKEKSRALVGVGARPEDVQKLIKVIDELGQFVKQNATRVPQRTQRTPTKPRSTKPLSRPLNPKTTTTPPSLGKVTLESGNITPETFQRLVDSILALDSIEIEPIDDPELAKLELETLEAMTKGDWYKGLDKDKKTRAYEFLLKYAEQIEDKEIIERFKKELENAKQ